MFKFSWLFLSVFILAISCKSDSVDKDVKNNDSIQEESMVTLPDYENIYKSENLGPLFEKYTPFTLTTDMSAISETEKSLIKKLIQAATIMDRCFWYEAYGDKQALLSSISDKNLRTFAEINYGPWDRLDGNKPFIDGVGEKAAGSNYYPKDMTKEEFESWDEPNKDSLYTFIRRDNKGDLKQVAFHDHFSKEVNQAAKLLNEAAELSENKALTKYLKLRAIALKNDKYQESDMAWLDMKDNHIDVVIGPIETYEDQLFGYKAAHEAYVLVKDMVWSERLEKYAQFLPTLQKGLPVPEAYKAEEPGRDTELNAYDVIYYSGDCNAGSKTIAINLPNDEHVQLVKGTRRLQLKNAMKAKFEKILVPISKSLIDPEQQKHITFDAFFSNTMFHEVAHGLGIKNTIDGNSTVRKALKEHASSIEEGKADMLGLYMIKQLHDAGELEEDIMDYYVTFMAGIFRSVRFGASSAHGKANMIRFNFFDEMGAFTKNKETGYYIVNEKKLEEAMEALSNKILTLQGDGDYDKVSQLVSGYGVIKSDLKSDLSKLADEGIPVDVVFNQGIDILGL
jgi:hypothetical protein